MPTLPPHLIDAIKAEAEKTNIRRVSIRTKVNYKTIWRICKGKQLHCGDETLTKLLAEFEGTGTEALPSAIVRTESALAASYPPVRLRMVYPDEYWEDLLIASKLIAMGTSLSRLMQRKTWIEGILSRGGSIQVLFVDPDSSAVKYSAMQELGACDAPTLKAFRRKQSEALAWLISQKQTEKIEFLKIDYALTFGLDVIEVPNRARSIYVRFYPLVQSGEEDRPICEVRGDNPLWYELFEGQLKAHLAKAKPCDARCMARLLKGFRSESTKLASNTRSSGPKGGIERGHR